MTSARHIVYVSHGGGPLPVLGDPAHTEMVSTLGQMALQIGKPRAILVISAHWETEFPTVTTTERPPLIYDYGGFPTAAYELRYPCAGEPDLANRVVAALTSAGFKVESNATRGLDHGAFVPLMLMYPEADIPCVQLSLTRTLDAQWHIDIGKALASLEYDNLLIIGSGMSFHNLQAFFASADQQAKQKNLAFEAWLTSVMKDRAISELEREQLLVEWSSAPYARYCHPREEHLLPLHVCYGVAQSGSDNVNSTEIMQKQTSMYAWHRSHDATL